MTSRAAPQDRLTFDSRRYTVRQQLHGGHFATVYEAYDVEADARVALKVLRVAADGRRIAEAMFRKEVSALEGVEHPSIVRLRRHFEDAEREALVIDLELVPGGRTLQHLLEKARDKQTPPPPLAWRAALLLDILGALEFAHGRLVVHRDVKPANVLLTADDKGKLADFGTARVFANYGRGNESRTLREYFTRPYASPEQVLQRDATPASDLYSFAVLSVAVLSMLPPEREVEGADARAAVEALAESETPPAALAALGDVLARGLSTDPSLRPRSHEFEEVLRRLLESLRPREIAEVRIADSARGPAKDAGFATDAAILHDLNANLHARYEDGSPDGDGRARVVCYGQNLEVTFVTLRERTDRLLAVRAVRLAPPLLVRRRQETKRFPIHLALGDGSADPLIQAAFEVHQQESRQKQEKGDLERLFGPSKFVLERQREGLTHLLLVCRPLPPGESHRKSRNRNRRAVDMRGVVCLQLLSVRPFESRGPVPDDLVLRWADGLDERASFRLYRQPVATFRSFDPASQRLWLHFDEPIPADGVLTLELIDLALQTSLDRQERALRALGSGQTANPKLRHLLLHPADNLVERTAVADLVQPLQPAERVRELVSRILGAQGLFLLQGPPGTGKTTLIAEAVAQILSRTPTARVLIASQSHDAVDNALGRLEELARRQGTGWRMMRDVPEQARQPGRLGFESSFRQWAGRVRARSEAAFARRALSLDPAVAEAAGAILQAWRDRLGDSQDARQDFAASLQVVAATCLRVPKTLERLKEPFFDWVVVDEAAKATATEALVPMSAGKRILLVGDHRQLPPFLATEMAVLLKDAGHALERSRMSLFEALFPDMPSTSRETLRVQYRMHASIGSFVGRLYYADVGGLETGVADEARAIDVARFDRPCRIFWVDVAGQAERVGTSQRNDAEVAAVGRVVAALAKPGRTPPYEVAVIAPYLAQVERLRARRLEGQGLKIEAATVDAFQGQEVDAVVYSMVRDNPDASRFVTDPRRLNVAFSRCKRLLVLVGDFKAAQGSQSLGPIAEAIPSSNVLKAEAL